MTQKLWHFIDLVTNHQTGKLRESAFWVNVGKASMTVGFWYTVFKEGATFNSELWLIYGGYLLGHEALKAQQNQKQQILDKELKGN